MTNVRKFMALNGPQQLLFLRAVWLLGIYRLRLSLQPFKRLVRQLDHDTVPVAAPAADPRHWPDIRAVSVLVQAAARHTPWRSECLVQALAAQCLLRGLGVPGVLYLGATMHENGADPRKLEAHAWVKCGEYFVTGWHGHDRFTVISAFSWP